MIIERINIIWLPFSNREEERYVRSTWRQLICPSTHGDLDHTPAYFWGRFQDSRVNGAVVDDTWLLLVRMCAQDTQ